MVTYILILVALVALVVLCFWQGIKTYRDFDKNFGAFFLFWGLVCIGLGIWVSIHTTNVYLNQGTYEHKKRTYIVYTDYKDKTYYVDLITDIVKDTGLTTEEFEKLLKDKGFTEKETKR